MRALTRLVRIEFALIALAALAVLWFFAVPNVITPLSYGLLLGIVIALASIALITYKNAQAADSVAQLLHETEVTMSPAAPADPGSARPGSRS
jgi:hypothetical protein